MIVVAGKELTGQAIAPGSVPYGERGSLEAGLPGAGPGGGGIPPTSSGGPSVAGGPSGSPLERMLRGKDAPAGLPATDGLSIGPGATPVNPEVRQDPPVVEKLRVLATQAKVPRLRALARSALRSYYFEEGR